MGRTIIKIEGEYFVWSSVVDAPITYGMTKEELKTFIKDEEGNQGLENLDLRLARVDAKGTSSMIHNSLEEQISFNRAGEDEKCLTLDQIYKKYRRSEWAN